MLKNIILWVIIAAVLMSVFNNFGTRKTADATLAYSQFIDAVKAGQVKEVNVDGPSVKGIMQTGERFTTYSPGDPHMVDDLLANGVEIKARPPESQSLLMQIFISWFPMLLK